MDADATVGVRGISVGAGGGGPPGGRSGLLHPSGDQSHDPVGPPRDRLVMRDEHYRKPVGLVLLAERVEDSPPGLLVEIAGWLIGEEQTRLADERPGDRHPLHLPP